MSTSKLIKSLFKIDAAEGLVRYANAVKPFHSKILDVMIEYVYREDINVKVSEKWLTDIAQTHGVSPRYFDNITSNDQQTITFRGLVADIFVPGLRFLVTYDDNTTKTLIVSSSISNRISNQTVVEVVANQILSGAVVNVQIDIQTEYRTVGMFTGTDSKWYIHGDYSNEFLVGEKLIVTGNHITQPSVSIYTVKEQPYVEYNQIQHGVEPVTVIPIEEAIESYVEDNTYVKYTGTIKPTHNLFYDVSYNTSNLPPTTYPIGTVCVNPITNASLRLSSVGWIHNYTETTYAWNFSAATPKYIRVQYANADTNTFIIKATDAIIPTTFTVVSLTSNTFMMSQPFDIIGVNSITNAWIVNGVIDESTASPGQTIYVTSSTSSQGQGTYIVTGVVPGITPGTTQVQVSRQISRLAAGDGILSIPTKVEDIPNWVTGTSIKVSATGTMPTPLDESHHYYFIPVVPPITEHSTPAVFAISKTRNPRDWNDYVDIVTGGSGVLSIAQNEVYVPDTMISIRDSYLSRNNGNYTILQTTMYGDDVHVTVKEKIPYSSPDHLSFDGVLQYNIDTHVHKPKAPSVSLIHASASITEFIQFTFETVQREHITSHITENQPYTSLVVNGEFDIPGHDSSGFDGDLVFSTNIGSITPGIGTSSHNLFPLGFDTQLFDVGTMDETTNTVYHFYGTTQ